MTADQLGLLTGPVAAVVVLLVMNWLFYTGRILPRNAVPREDYDALRQVNAIYADKFSQLIEAVKVLGVSVDRIRRTNGKK